MLSKIAKLLLISTSFAPVLITFAFTRYLAFGFEIVQISLIVVTILLVLLCLLIFQQAKTRLQVSQFQITSLKTADMEIVGFVIAYLLPFINSSPLQMNFAVLAFVILILAVIAATSNSYHFNPLLAISGYHFYEVSTPDSITYLLISKKDIRKCASVKSVVQLTNYIVLDSEV